jgi:hypothetical protein
MEPGIEQGFHQKKPALRVGYGDVRRVSKEVA